jgi:membrane protease subunit HflC|tara:strand:- start:109 stop:1044 length:936 start_codon:yes stop_codon:yes gene_type:complete
VSRNLTALGVIVLGVGFVLTSAIYTVTEIDQVIITRFGEPVSDPITEPGLHFRTPFVDTVNRFEKRFLEWDGVPNQVPTRDRRFIFVDTYARWRITDPLRYLETLQGSEITAQSRLADILDGETRNAIARHDLIEIVRTSNRQPANTAVGPEEEPETLEPISTGRGEITREILAAATDAVSEYGIELLDLQFKRINYVPEVQQDVFARMIAERQRIAEEFRSEGQGESARIQGERERDLAQIQSEAFRAAEELRGTADAEATSVYADAYGSDAAFYAFTKSLETYERTMDPNTFFILGTDSELLRFLENPR